MWALVKDGKVNTIYGGAKSVIIGDIKYPKEIFTLWTEEERKAIGVYLIIIKDPSSYDSTFSDTGTRSYTYNSDTDTVNETFDVTDKNLASLKVDFTLGENLQAQIRLEGYDWVATRYIWDNSKTLPDAVKTYTIAVRSHVNTTCTAIDNCSDLDALKVVHGKLQSDGEYGQAWPDESSILHYRRDN